MRNDPREEAVHPMSEGDKAVVRPELQGALSEDPNAAEEIYIPDYVMHDFDFTEHRENTRRPVARVYFNAR